MNSQTHMPMYIHTYIHAWTEMYSYTCSQAHPYFHMCTEARQWICIVLWYRTEDQQELGNLGRLQSGLSSQLLEPGLREMRSSKQM